MKILKVGMIGRGAVGTLFGRIIQKRIGNENFFFIVGEDRIEEYQNKPFYCNESKCDFRYVTPNHFESVDLLIIATKYPVLKSTLELVKPFVKKDTIILCLLNGIVSETIVEKTLQKGIVLHSIAQLMDSVKSKNHVVYTKTGEIVVGTNDKEKLGAVQKVASFFEEVELPHHIAEDIIHEQWSKLMLNCGINQICAAYDVPYRNCQSGGELHEMFVNTMKEVQMIAKLEGIIISNEEIQTWVENLDKLSPESMPSMRQDTLAKRQTEVDLFAKTMMDLARKHQVEVPMNEKLYRRIKMIEETIVNLIDKQNVAFISSIDENSYPNTKAMLPPRKREGIKEFYFTTNTSSMRVEQYKKNSQACIYFCDKDLFMGVMFIGTMEVLEDKIHKEMIWREGDTMYYSKGVSDPDYCVLKFTAKQGRFYSNFSSETFDVE